MWSRGQEGRSLTPPSFFMFSTPKQGYNGSKRSKIEGKIMAGQTVTQYPQCGGIR